MEPDYMKRDMRSGSLWFLLCILLLGAVIEWSNYHTLPQQLRSTPDEKQLTDFTVSRARSNLKALTSIGTRVTGSKANEYTTPIFLMDKLQQIQTTLGPGAKLELSLQTPSSSFYIDFLGGMENVYRNVTNVVARLSWPGTSKDSSAILVNAHFDSVPGSPGAADDGVGIAVMLESIESLGSSSVPLARPIVFLFNGAEEWVHHGAHGFITQHPWARDIDYLINLEAIGSGGREMLFQCNSGQVAELYGRAAPYPQASVLAHELFKHFLYRVASTDWSTFIRYGKDLYGRTIRGYDTAYVDNGYVYHTSFDRADVVPDGTLQNTGENLVHVIRAISSASLPTNPNDESAVFFDLFHTILVRYSGAGVKTVHWSIAIIGIVTCLLLSGRQLEDLRLATYLEATMLFYTLLCGCAVGLIAFAFFPMRWYEGGLPMAVLIFIPPLFLMNLHLRGGQAETYLRVTSLQRILAVLVIYILQVIPMIILDVMTAYLGCLWILALSISAWVHHFVSQHRVQSLLSLSSRDSKSAHGGSLQPSSMLSMYDRWQEQAYLLSMFPIVIIWYKTLNATLVMTLPLFGKTGTVVPTDMALGGLFAAVVALPFGSFLACSVHRRLPRATFLSSVYAIVAIYVAIAALTFSYSSARPKRLWIQSLERYYRQPAAPSRFLPKHLSKTPLTDQSQQVLMDSGLWVSGFDERGLDPLLPYIFDYLDQKPSPPEPALPILSLGRYLEGVHRAYLSQDSYFLERNHDCALSYGDCFFAFPWYFPVPDALRHGLYLPTLNPSPPVPLDNKLQLTLKATYLQGAVSVPSCDLSQGPLRLVTITAAGPSHMNLVLRDHNSGNRIKAWFSDVSHPETELSSQEVMRKLSCASPARSEGVHYFHLGTGRCTAPAKESSLICSTYRFYVIVSGEEPIEVALYGHFVDLTQDEQVVSFIHKMPSWSRGSEWTRFPSVLISDII